MSSQPSSSGDEKETPRLTEEASSQMLAREANGKSRFLGHTLVDFYKYNCKILPKPPDEEPIPSAE